VLAVGDILKVKIIQVDEKRNRISLSLKGVKQ
jgi:ribosomal protein S1